MCRSPLTFTGEVQLAVPGDLIEHMVKKTDAGADIRDISPLPSMFRTTEILVSAVVPLVDEPCAAPA